MVPIEDLILYELHIGSYHAPDGPPGTFADATARLEHVQNLGANALAIMPVHEFPYDLSWGYNPQDLYAVELAYGGPEGLRDFTNAAHERDLLVIADVVYNHLDGSTHLCGWVPEASGCGGPYFYADPDLGQTDWGPRPNYADPNVRRWLREHPVDWMRQFGIDGYRLDSTSNIRATRHARGPEIPEGRTLLQEMTSDVRALGGVMIAEDLQGDPWITRPDGAGFHAQWDAGFAYVVREQLLASALETELDIRRLQRLFEEVAAEPFQRVIYAESHDSTGELNGHQRLIQDLRDATDDARAAALLRVGTAFTLTVPGVPMLLQGQEFEQAGAFHDSQPLRWELAQGLTLEVTRALVSARRTLPGLRSPDLEVRHINPGAGVFAYRRGEDVMVLVNLSKTTFDGYRIGVPREGRWEVVVDTSLAQADASGEATALSYDGYEASVEMRLAPFSVLIVRHAP